MVFGFLQGFSVNKLKPNLKMAVHRFQISSNKKTNLIKAQKKEIAKLLQERPPKEEKARIRAEGLIREDSNIEAYEILELMCDLLHERMRLIETTKECPGDLKSTAMANTNGVLNERVVLKLSVQPPSAFQVISYLRVIADEHGFEYDPDVDITAGGAMAAPTGFSVPVAPGSGYGQIYAQPEGQAPELPSGWTYEAGLLA
ncbi:hypothetical protein TrRE_jg5345, partial [Triparma retinervis]